MFHQELNENSPQFDGFIVGLLLSSQEKRKKPTHNKEWPTQIQYKLEDVLEDHKRGL